MSEDEIEKANIPSEHFIEQTKLNDSNSQLHKTNLTNHTVLETLNITSDEGEHFTKPISFSFVQITM